MGRAPAPEAAWDAAHFRQQREKNRAYYREHLVENKLAIAQLTQKLQNTLLLRAEDEGGTGRAGRLRPELAWRAGALGDERVFSPPVAAGAGRAVRGPAAGRLGLAEPAAGEAGRPGVFLGGGVGGANPCG